MRNLDKYISSIYIKHLGKLGVVFSLWSFQKGADIKRNENVDHFVELPIKKTTHQLGLFRNLRASNFSESSPRQIPRPACSKSLATQSSGKHSYRDPGETPSQVPRKGGDGQITGGSNMWLLLPRKWSRFFLVYGDVWCMPCIPLSTWKFSNKTTPPRDQGRRGETWVEGELDQGSWRTTEAKVSALGSPNSRPVALRKVRSRHSLISNKRSMICVSE